MKITGARSSAGAIHRNETVAHNSLRPHKTKRTAGTGFDVESTTRCVMYGVRRAINYIFTLAAILCCVDW